MNLKKFFHRPALAIIAIFSGCIPLVSCGTHHHADGWYFLRTPSSKVTGKPLFSSADYEKTVTDLSENPGYAAISIRLKPDRTRRLAYATGKNIGMYLAYVHKDSVITCPRINTAIEGGAMQIISPDAALIARIHDSIGNAMPEQETFSAGDGVTIHVVSPEVIDNMVDSLVR